MKTMLPLLITFIFSAPLFAKQTRSVAQLYKTSDKMGSECGLADDWQDLVDQTVLNDFSQPSKKHRIKSLPQVAKTQLIQAANDNRLSYNKDEPNIETVEKALEYLRANSEGEEVYTYKVTVGKKSFASVNHYPGGNQFGLIYPWGSTKAVAVISDDTINCIK